MARVNTYLNFQGNTEQAFLFYQSVFGGEFTGGIRRYRDIPPMPDCPPPAEAEADYVMHVELPLYGGHSLMGTDTPEAMGKLTFGNNISISLEPDTRAETERLFHALSEGGKIEMPLQDMFWGAYFGSLTDRFGVQWMFNCAVKG